MISKEKKDHSNMHHNALVATLVAPAIHKHKSRLTAVDNTFVVTCYEHSNVTATSNRHTVIISYLNANSPVVHFNKDHILIHALVSPRSSYSSHMAIIKHIHVYNNNSNAINKLIRDTNKR